MTGLLWAFLLVFALDALVVTLFSGTLPVNEKGFHFSGYKGQ